MLNVKYTIKTTRN